MKNLEELDFKKRVMQMVHNFYGSKDSDAIFNFELDDRIVQCQITLVDEEEPEFIDYDGVPVIDLPYE